MLARISMFILIILRLYQSPYQWVFASITIVLFTLMLFKYFRIFPPIALYIHFVGEILKREILKSLVIILVVILASFGGIRLTGRSDLKMDVLLVAIIYLISLLIFIIVVLNIVVAQFVFTFNNLLKMEMGLQHVKIELIVESELKSSIAMFFGRKFRNYSTVTELTVPHKNWSTYSKTKLLENPWREHYMKLNERSEKKLKIQNECLQESIAELKLKQEKSLDSNKVLELKLNSLDAKLNKLLEK